MRVTLSASLREAQAQIHRTEAQLAARQRELSSGRRINAPSDDPSGTAGAISGRSALARIDSYVRATDSVEGRLSIVDSVLSDTITQVTAALSSAAGARGTTATSAQRDAIATELEGVRDTIFADVTTLFRGSFLFAGAATTTQPYTTSGGVISSYQGDQTVVSVDVDSSVAIQVSVSGDALLRGTDANDLFVELDQLITAVRADNQTGIDTGIAALERQFDRATTMQSRVGSDLARLGHQRARLGARRLENLKQVSRDEDVDLIEAIIGLQEAERASQAAIRAIGVRVPLSLLDFIR